MTGGAVDLVVAGAVVVGAVRSSDVLTEARLRAGGWPLWRCGPALPAVVVHDVVAGLAGYLVLVTLPLSLLHPPTSRGQAALATGVGVLVTLAATGWLLHRRRGFPVAAIGRPGAFAQEPVLTARGRLLEIVERAADRASSRWLAEQLEAGRRRAGAIDEQLLPAVWAPARIRLRETVGASKTEVALLLLQAQSVVDDGSPPAERLLALLHLVYQRGGCGAVRSVLGAAARGPLRHGRPGSIVGMPVGMPGGMSGGPSIRMPGGPSVPGGPGGPAGPAAAPSPYSTSSSI